LEDPHTDGRILLQGITNTQSGEWGRYRPAQSEPGEGSMTGSCEQRHESLVFTKDTEFLIRLSNK